MKALPIGVEFLNNLLLGEKDGEHYFYVDKTPLIWELAGTEGEVHLITCPRRFGKTLNLDMIRAFVNAAPETDRNLFQGLEISEDRAFCAAFQGQFPVLYCNMKDVNGLSFEEACEAFSSEIVYLMSRYYGFLKTSPRLRLDEQKTCQWYADMLAWRNEKGYRTDALPVPELKRALKNLSHCLERHYGRKVVVLIDEYDRPMYSAWVHEREDPGYLDRMGELMQGVYTELFRDNASIAFAVLTGHMQVDLERIFAGVDNLTVWGLDRQFKRDYLGFTEAEVKNMLACYGLESHFDEMKEWYDGYLFGEEHVYCPWDVLRYVDNMISPRSSKVPQLFSANSSSVGEIVIDLLRKADPEIRQDYCRLMNGETIRGRVIRRLTYSDLERADGLWSLLAAAGYLTVLLEAEDGAAILRAPNLEMRKLLKVQYKRWRKDLSVKGRLPMGGWLASL